MPAAGESPAITALKAVIKLYGDDALDEIIIACVMAEKEREKPARQRRLATALLAIIERRISGVDIGREDA